VDITKPHRISYLLDEVDHLARIRNMMAFRFTAGIISIILLPCAWSFSPISSTAVHRGRSRSAIEKGVYSPTTDALFRVKASFSTVRSDTSVAVETKNPTDLADSETASAVSPPPSSDRISVPRPKTHYTVPGFKVGWQDAEGNWFDEDGPRNGPPQNYWRQAADDREYSKNMEAVDAVLSGTDMEETLRNLEKRCGVRFPSLNRKILGSWAPLLHCGVNLVANPDDAATGKDIEVPFTVDVFRKHGRKLGPKNHYGVFDAKLENGEELTIKTNTVARGSSPCGTVVADEKNESLVLGNVEHVNLDMPLTFGKITYISDYVLIQRYGEGGLDLWLRCDDSYLGVDI